MDKYCAWPYLFRAITDGKLSLLVSPFDFFFFLTISNALTACACGVTSWNECCCFHVELENSIIKKWRVVWSKFNFLLFLYHKIVSFVIPAFPFIYSLIIVFYQRSRCFSRRVNSSLIYVVPVIFERIFSAFLNWLCVQRYLNYFAISFRRNRTRKM